MMKMNEEDKLGEVTASTTLSCSALNLRMKDPVGGRYKPFISQFQKMFSGKKKLMKNKKQLTKINDIEGSRIF